MGEKKEEGEQIAKQPNSVCEIHILGMGTVLTSNLRLKALLTFSQEIACHLKMQTD